MEKNYNTDNFEQLLRDTTDEFRMYPSRRVWHSIYNDLHPDRKWPSLAILLLFITSIMYVGITNSTDAGGTNPAAVITAPVKQDNLLADASRPFQQGNNTNDPVGLTDNIPDGSATSVMNDVTTVALKSSND